MLISNYARNKLRKRSMRYLFDELAQESQIDMLCYIRSRFSAPQLTLDN